MQQEQNNKSSRKYLLSLLYTLKDLLFLTLKSGIIGALILNILMYVVFKETFDTIGCLAYIVCGGSIGIVIGYIIKAVRGQDEGDAFANATGVTMYNMYAGDTQNRKIHYYAEYECGSEVKTGIEDIPEDIKIDDEDGFMTWLDENATDFAELI